MPKPGPVGTDSCVQIPFMNFSGSAKDERGVAPRFQPPSLARGVTPPHCKVPVSYTGIALVYLAPVRRGAHPVWVDIRASTSSRSPPPGRAAFFARAVDLSATMCCESSVTKARNGTSHCRGLVLCPIYNTQP